MLISQFFTLSGWLLFSAVKFFYAPGSIYILGGYSYWETIFISVSGGWLGVFAFYYFGKVIFRFWKYLSYRLIKSKPKKKFTRVNKIIIRIKNHPFGLIGLALLSPSLLSIPLGSFLAAKYYSHRKTTVPVFMSAVVFWAFLLTTLVSYFDIRFYKE